jgi:tetratricopeptide (TPR) repeat protein
MIRRSFQPPTRCLLALAAFLSTSLLGFADSVDDLLKKGDVLDVKLKAAEALDPYLQAEKLQPKDARILVRIARQYRHLMADASAKNEKLRLGAISLTYAQRAAALAPRDSDAQLSPAISYGKILPLQGTKEQMAASKLIKDAAERAVKLDSKNDLAWHILGRWHRLMADVGSVKRAMASVFYESLPEASNDEAIRCFQKAIAINPNRLMHWVELGRVYAQMGQADNARINLQKGLSMPCVDKDDPECKVHARETLANL